MGVMVAKTAATNLTPGMCNSRDVFLPVVSMLSVSWLDLFC